MTAGCRPTSPIAQAAVEGTASPPAGTAARNRSRSPRKVARKPAIVEESAAEKKPLEVNDAAKPSCRHVAIVGGGAVGANTAFCIATARIGHGKLTITDIAAEMLEGQVMDMEDTGMNCTAASPKEAGQADVIIITAGRGVRDGETRLDCLKANYNILRSIVNGTKPIKKSAVIIVVSNPCDVWHISCGSSLAFHRVKSLAQAPL